jgi:hypothetical protein
MLNRARASEALLLSDVHLMYAGVCEVGENNPIVGVPSLFRATRGIASLLSFTFIEEQSDCTRSLFHASKHRADKVNIQSKIAKHHQRSEVWYAQLKPRLGSSCRAARTHCRVLGDPQDGAIACHLGRTREIIVQPLGNIL